MYQSTTKLSEIDIENLLRIAIKAGEAIMDVYRQQFDVTIKEDGSPLTLADQASNQIITDYLLSQYSIPILSEENDYIPFETRKSWTQYWCIDPLDGTKEFVAKRREFTVNIALIQNNRPILGIIYAPVFGDLFYAIQGQGAFFRYRDDEILLYTPSKFKFENQTLITDKHHLKLILSRSHSDGLQIDDFIDLDLHSIQTISMGSSLKFCRIAQGNVDMNIRTKPTSEWDTAAAQIILEESGHQLLQLSNGHPLLYNKENILNPSFVAI